MDIFEGLPGMPGLFMASLFSASLRLVFTHLNHFIPNINVHKYCFDMFKWSYYLFQWFLVKMIRTDLLLEIVNLYMRQSLYFGVMMVNK